MKWIPAMRRMDLGGLIPLGIMASLMLMSLVK